jgi:thioredoxin
MKKIFISYRRDDSRWQADRIYKALRDVLPHERLFMDIDSIPPGVDFVATLERWVGECEIMLALIGKEWINAADPRTGQRRLDNPNDFVRIEIREALTRGIPLVPVLLDDAPMPDEVKLPDDLKSLVRRQAEFVQFRTFDADMARLMGKLGVAAGGVAEADARPPASAGINVGVATAGAGDVVIDTTTQTFRKDVLEESRKQPVLVDFWASWCGPCKQLTPILEKAVRSAKGAVKLAKMNIDEHPQIASQMRIQSIPAVIAFIAGQPVDGFMGALPESQVIAFLERLPRQESGGFTTSASA